MKIGILTTGHRPEALPEFKSYAGMFGDLLAGQGFTFENYDVLDGELPASVTDADGWLITGSRHGAYEALPWIKPLEAFIRALYAADIPLVGICFGHQIIAQALGGKVEKFAGGWAVGRTEYAFGDKTLALQAWHQDQVTERPEAASVIASNAFCQNAGLVYGNKVFSVQPHPEYSADFIEGLMEHRGGAVPPADITKARESLRQPLDANILAAQIGQFFRERSLA